nr:hypothetical protein [Tanacetum cinerariifolium]
ELYDSIKITRAKCIKQVTKVTTENMNLKTGISKATVNPLVSARDKHAIDVEPIVPRLMNNRNAHLDYLRHLKESVETIRDIVEEAKVVRPLDRSIVSACRYTKHSQELLEYAIGTCPHGSQPHRMADVNAPSDQTPTMAPPVQTLREALQITPVNRNRAFAAPPSINGLVDFVNQLGYPKEKEGHSDCDSKRSVHQADHPPSSEEAQVPPKTDSPLHIAKGTKREIFRMPIPGRLITANIRAAPYYQEYQENVAKHRGFLAGETRSTQDLPASRPTKLARKPQSTAQKSPPKPSISSPVTTTQPAPTSVPAKIQENKCKQTTGTTDKPTKAKRIKRSVSRKTRQSRSSSKSVGESEAEEVPAEKPQIADKDADFQKAVEESMKDAYALPKGPLPPVVAHDLLSLQKHKKTSPADQYIFQRRVSEPTASSFHDAGPDLNAQTEGQTRSDTSAQAEGQAGSNPDETSEGQAGSNPNETSEGQARPDPGNAEARVQSTSSPVVHAGSDREHMNIDVANVSLQPSTKQLYEGFTATIYPNIQENLKLVVDESVLLEEPASSSGTLSSLQHLSRDFIFGDQFFSDKPSDADKSAETEVESMVNVPIQQAMSSIPLMTSPIIDLTLRPESPKEHPQLKATTTDTTTTTTTLPPPQAPQQSTTDAMMVKHIGELEHTLADLIQVSIAVSEVVMNAVDWAMQALLRNHFRDLLEADMKVILHQHMWETDSYKSHKVHMQLFEALEKSINHDQSEELTHDLAEARKKRKKGRESPKTPPGLPSHQPPPPPPPVGPSGMSGAPRASGSQVTPPPPPPPPTSTNQDNLDMDEAMGPDEQAQLSDEEDIESAHIPTVNLRQGWWKPFEEERPTTPEPAWSIRSSDVPVPPNNWASTLASNYLPPPKDSLLAQIGDITTFIDWFCKRWGITELKPQDLKGPAYEILKIVLRRADLNEHVIAERDFKYLYLSDFEDLNLLNLQGHLNHLPPKDKKILTTAVNQWTRQLVIRHRVEDFQLWIESYQTQVNLTKPQWTATGFEYKHDYTVIESPRAVIFLDKYRVQMMMHFNEIHKFKAFEDTENLSQPGELCWRSRKRGRLQIVEAYRLIN